MIRSAPDRRFPFKIRALSARRIAAVVALGGGLVLPGGAHAERIENQVAIFSALDKVTARISQFEVALGKTATFGPLRVTPRVCFSRPTTEQPKTSTFVEVDEIQLDGKESRVFTGWMFAESPGLYGVEHPTADVWLSACQGAKAVAQKAAPKPRPDAGAAEGGSDPAAADGADAAPDDTAPAAVDQEPRRRVRR